MGFENHVLTGGEHLVGDVQLLPSLHQPIIPWLFCRCAQAFLAAKSPQGSSRAGTTGLIVYSWGCTCYEHGFTDSMGYMIWIIKLLHSQGQNSVYRVRSCQARVWLKTGRGGVRRGGCWHGKVLKFQK